RIKRFTFYLCTEYFHVPCSSGTYSLSLHDALPISASSSRQRATICTTIRAARFLTAFPASGPAAQATAEARSRKRLPSSSARSRSEEHTSELQSREKLVCRLLLEKKNVRKCITVNI